MNHLTLEKLNTNVSELQREVELFRSLIIGLIGRGEDESYNPEFVKKVLKASREKPKHTFSDKKTFLSQLKNL